MSGNWHSGEAPEHWPRRYGFDRYFGLISGTSSYYSPRQQEGAMERRMAKDDETWFLPEDGSFYLTDAIMDAAIGHINAHHGTDTGTPFFLYLAYAAPHW